MLAVIVIVIVIVIVQVSCPRLPTCSQSSQGKPLSAQACIIWSRNCRNGFWWSTQWLGRKWLSSGECRCIIVFPSVIAIVIIVVIVIVIVQVPAQGLGLSHLWRGPTQQWRLGKLTHINTFTFWTNSSVMLNLPCLWTHTVLAFPPQIGYCRDYMTFWSCLYSTDFTRRLNRLCSDK